MNFFKDNFKKEIEQATAAFPARDILYDFVQAYNSYSSLHHNFAEDINLTSVEAHTLKHICQNEGVTISDIVSYWGRTKGTVSAQVSSLEEKGLVFRKRCQNNRKKVHIFPTQKGFEVNQRHVEFDIKESSDLIDRWTEKYTINELNLFFEQMAFYTEFMATKAKKTE